MDISVPDNGLLRALSSTAPNVDASEISPAVRLPGGNDLGVGWIGSLEILEKLSMVRNRVICVEPGGIRTSGCQFVRVKIVSVVVK